MLEGEEVVALMVMAGSWSVEVGGWVHGERF